MSDTIIVTIISMIPALIVSVASIITSIHNLKTIKQSNAAAGVLIKETAKAAAAILKTASDAAAKKK